MRGRFTPGALAVVFFLSTTPVWGQPKTDVVTLGNGDRITGEIKGLARGRLEFSTDDVGTLEIEWVKIMKVEAIREFEVITTDGRRLLGSLGRSPVNQAVLLVTTTGELSLPVSDVTEMAPIGKSFWKKLDGSVDAGFNYTRSSGIAQTTFNSTIAYRRPAFLVEITSSATLTQTDDGANNDDRADLDVSYIRYRWRKWFISGAGRLEQNESLGLALRSQVGGSVGARFVNTNRAQFAFAMGLVGNNEQGVDTEATQNLEGAFGLTTSFYSYDRPKTNFDSNFQYYPSLSDWGRQRLQFDLGVKRELLKDFYVGLNMFDTFDSRPPDPNAALNDIGVTATVGWSY
jgi:uncharacterized protein DUF481